MRQVVFEANFGNGGVKTLFPNRPIGAVYPPHQGQQGRRDEHREGGACAMAPGHPLVFQALWFPLRGSSLQTPKHPVFARRILKAQDPRWSSYRNVNVPPHRLLTLSAIFGAASLACLPSEGRR